MQKLKAQGRLLLVGHVLGLLSVLLLSVAGVGWLSGGADVASERLGIALDGDTSRSLAAVAGFFKGLLDLWPIPLVAWFAWRRDWRAVAAVWVVAVAFIPGADLLVWTLSAMGGVGPGIHLVYAAAMGGSAVAYIVATSPGVTRQHS